MAGLDSLGKGNGQAFLISAAVMLEAVAAACSSPQTTEINASARADTLMKWVHIGLGIGAVLVTIGAVIEPAHRPAILAGGFGTGAVFYGLYRHAHASGLQNGGPGTESY